MRYAIAVILVAVGLLLLQQHRINNLQGQNESLAATKATLLDTIAQYKTKNGLQAAQIGEIRLSLDELKKYRAEDLKLIESLKTKGRDIHHYTKVETVTHDTVYSVLRDSVYMSDTITAVKRFDIEKRWYSLHGYIDGDTLNGYLNTRSSLHIVETVKYKRFLGFLWKTNKVKDRKVDVASLNPNETIENVEFIVIDK